MRLKNISKRTASERHDVASRMAVKRRAKHRSSVLVVLINGSAARHQRGDMQPWRGCV